MPELIDRIELRKDFCNMCEAMQPEMIDCEKKGCMSMQIIDDQPTIEAEPVRRGRWIMLEPYGAHNTHRRKCSECGEIKAKELTNFCPNCGADMRATDTNVGGKGGADNG